MGRLTATLKVLEEVARAHPHERRTEFADYLRAQTQRIPDHAGAGRDGDHDAAGDGGQDLAGTGVQPARGMPPAPLRTQRTHLTLNCC